MTTSPMNYVLFHEQVASRRAAFWQSVIKQAFPTKSGDASMYVYQEHRRYVFTEQGVSDLLKVRDRIANAFRVAGAITMERAISGLGCSDSWDLLALVDYLVEIGEIREITGSGCAGQYRVFVPIRECL